MGAQEAEKDTGSEIQETGRGLGDGPHEKGGEGHTWGERGVDGGRAGELSTRC